MVATLVKSALKQWNTTQPYWLGLTKCQQIGKRTWNAWPGFYSITSEQTLHRNIRTRCLAILTDVCRVTTHHVHGGHIRNYHTVSLKSTDPMQTVTSQHMWVHQACVIAFNHEFDTAHTMYWPGSILIIFRAHCSPLLIIFACGEDTATHPGTRTWPGKTASTREPGYKLQKVNALH